jgi:hypothetical protein
MILPAPLAVLPAVLKTWLKRLRRMLQPTRHVPVLMMSLRALKMQVGQVARNRPPRQRRLPRPRRVQLTMSLTRLMMPDVPATMWLMLQTILPMLRRAQHSNVPAILS